MTSPPRAGPSGLASVAEPDHHVQPPEPEGHRAPPTRGPRDPPGLGLPPGQGPRLLLPLQHHLEGPLRIRTRIHPSPHLPARTPNHQVRSAYYECSTTAVLSVIADQKSST